ncbi:MAG: DUF4105 domain-containing protein [Calditrichaeota bacterium]|nr:DUF4105 domain-containing protein [Calditrichota bacterium]
MARNSRLLLLFIFFLTLQLSAADMPWGKGLSKPENLIFKLVTFGPGDDIPSYWGHLSLIVEDTLYNVSAIYNFGLYSFDETMIYRFAMGRLIFEVGRASVASYFNYYRSENRDIRILTLFIPLKNRLRLAEKLEWYVKPENKKYLYHHFYDNCATRLRDLIDQALDGQFYKATQVPARMTLRQHTRRYLAKDPPLEMLLMFLMNDQIDKPIKEWDEMFLPDELERHLRTLTFTDSSGNSHPAVTNYQIFYKADRPPVPETVPKHEFKALLLSLFIGLLILATVWLQMKKPFRWFQLIFSIYNFLLGLVLGIPGTALFFFALFTEHDVTYHNENLFLAHPITLLIVPFAVLLAWQKQWAFTALRWLWDIQLAGAIILLLLKLFPAFDQDNALIFALILPITISMALSFHLLPKILFGDFKQN